MSEANKVATMKELEVISKDLQQASIDLQDFQKRIDDAKAKAEKDLAAKQQDLFPVVSKKVATAIAAVAKEKGLAYVFDISAQSGFNNVVYFDGGENVTDAVKTKLGISLTATPPATVKTPASTTPAKKN